MRTNYTAYVSREILLETAQALEQLRRSSEELRATVLLVRKTVRNINASK